MKTPEQIADERLEAMYNGDGTWDRRDLMIAAIAADRAQRSPRPAVYIVQNDTGDVVDSFQDADEATAAYQDGYTVAEEMPWAPGEYAEYRIAELTRMWQESTGDTAADYALSEDDWRAGLDDDEAAEIARLIEYQKEQNA